MPPKATFNNKIIELSIEKEVKKVTLPIARKIATDFFEKNLDQLIEDIEQDKASIEIRKQNEVERSKFIRGVGSQKHGGNLFSFFGFESGSDPVGVLINQLKNLKESFVRESKNAKLIKNFYVFRFTLPSDKQIKKNNPLDWTTRSWISALENGLNNITNYIRKRGKGRSEGGVQINREIDKIFIPQRNYFTSKYNSFIRRLKSGRTVK